MEKSYAQHYALLEGEHWWFRARRMILGDLLTHLAWPPRPKILEIGIGPGYNLLEIYPADARLEGVESDDALARLAARRGPARVFQASINRLPSEIQDGSYDGDTNAVLFTLFGAERFLLRYLDFPFGVSIFAAARKQ